MSKKPKYKPEIGMTNIGWDVGPILASIGQIIAKLEHTAARLSLFLAIFAGTALVMLALLLAKLSGQFASIGTQPTRYYP